MNKIIISTIIVLGILFAGCQNDLAPITTNSDEALRLFLQGRELTDKLRASESAEYFKQATELDSNFALAYLSLALAQASPRQVYYYLDRAKSKIDLVSDAEKILILGVEAGLSGLPGKQREYFEKLVQMYPNDPRVHNTLGNHYYGNQEYDLAIQQYKMAIKLDPDYTQPYNQIGYSYRFSGDYAKAEEAFKKYISLIPDDSNPYDSYAELLLEMGEYEVSIEMYEKAIEINPEFANSYLGIATNLNLKNEHDLARKKLKEMFHRVENEGQRRQAMTAMAISFIDEGKYLPALKMIEKQHSIAKQNADTLNMAVDYNLMALINYENGKIDHSEELWHNMLALVDSSTQPEDIKNAWRRIYWFNKTKVAVARNNISQAWEYQKRFLNMATHAGSIFQIRAAHELAGIILSAEQKFDESIAELEQSNLQNPYNLYRLGQAYQAKGDANMAMEFYQRAANANTFNSLGYAFIRIAAEQKVNALKR